MRKEDRKQYINKRAINVFLNLFKLKYVIKYTIVVIIIKYAHIKKTLLTSHRNFQRHT